MFYYNLLERLSFWTFFGVPKTKLKKDYQKGLAQIKSLDFNKLILDKILIEHYSTQLINYVYFLKLFEIADLREEFTRIFKEIFIGKKLSNYMYMNKIYTMTHFIIAASYYYQKFASKKEFDWILAYFKENINEILKRCNVDIIAEVGLCFKLCKLKPPVQIKPYVEKQYNEQLGFIPRDPTNSLEKAEHTNAVVLLFLTDFKKLYPGPDISNRIN